MLNDETVWHCLAHHSCSFRVRWKTPKQDFCQNKHNVTGLCNRVSCPLANSQYATVLEEEGSAFLYMKTVERAHTPKDLWEKVKLSNNFMQSLAQIDAHLEYWPQHMINRCKQRMTKIRQMLGRMRRIALQDKQTVLVPIKKKTEKRERHRELKAEAAAKVDLAIEKELLERLKQGTYGDIYNFSQKAFDSVVNKEGEVESESEDEDEQEAEYVMDMNDDSDSGVEEVTDEKTLKRLREAEMEDEQDLENIADRPSALRKKKKIRGPRVEIEYEQEMEDA